MNNFFYNDFEFSIVKNGSGWDISRMLPNGDFAVIGVGLFNDLNEEDA